VSLYNFIQDNKTRWSIRLLCRVLEVARSAYNQWAQAQSTDHETDAVRLTVHIKAIHRQSRGTYGSPRVHRELLEQGFKVGRHRVARLLRENGLSGTPKRRFRPTTTDSEHADPIAENLLNRDFTASSPNQAWVGDITYLHTQSGFVYLAVLIDLFSRKVVGWALMDHMRTELCLTALQQAVALRGPPRGLLHHTDRGSQYTSDAYQAALTALGATPSMSRKGNCWDNAVSESFFGTLEQELVGQVPLWRDLEAVQGAVSDYIYGFYNSQRRHSTLDYQSPNAFERSHRVLSQAAA